LVYGISCGLNLDAAGEKYHSAACANSCDGLMVNRRPTAVKAYRWAQIPIARLPPCISAPVDGAKTIPLTRLRMNLVNKKTISPLALLRYMHCYFFSIFEINSFCNALFIWNWHKPFFNSFTFFEEK